MDAACLRTPSRKTVARRFCSTPIRTSDAADNEVADGDVSSFLSALDDFVEQCDSFLPACPQFPSESDAAGSTSSFHGYFIKDSEGQILPERAMDDFVEQCDSVLPACPQVPPESDAAGGTSSFHGYFIKESEGPSLLERASTTWHSPCLDDDGVDSVKYADEAQTLSSAYCSSESECGETTQSEQYPSVSQHSVCSSARAWQSEPDFVGSSQNSHYDQKAEHGQGCKDKYEGVYLEHNASRTILQELNRENSKSTSKNEHFHSHSFQQEKTFVSTKCRGKTEEDHYTQNEQSFHGNCENVEHFANEGCRQEPRAGKESLQNCTQIEGAFETGGCPEAPHRKKSAQHYHHLNSSCEMQNASTSSCTHFKENLEEQQFEQHMKRFIKSCVMEDGSAFKECKDEPLDTEAEQYADSSDDSCVMVYASTFKNYDKVEEVKAQQDVESQDGSCILVDGSAFKEHKDESLEAELGQYAESSDDSCIMVDASTFKYDEVEEVEAKRYIESNNGNRVMNDASTFRRDEKPMKAGLTCPESLCHVHQRKCSCLSERHLVTHHENESNEYGVHCSTSCSHHGVFAADQKQVCECKAQCCSAYSLSSCLQPASSVGSICVPVHQTLSTGCKAQFDICYKSCTGDKQMPCVTPHKQDDQETIQPLEYTTSMSFSKFLPSEATTSDSDLSPANRTADVKTEPCSSIQDLTALSNSKASNVILKPQLRENSSANSPAFFTNIVQSLPNICARSSSCHEDNGQSVPGFKEADDNPVTALSGPSDDADADSSSYEEHKPKDNIMECSTDASEKMAILAGHKDHHNETDIVPAVDKECKGTSVAVSPNSKPVPFLDACLHLNHICDSADIFDTTLVAEVDRNIASCTQRCTKDGIRRPSPSCTVTSGDVFDLEVGTDDDTFVAEAQSPIATAKSTEYCQLPQSSSVTSGDVLDLGVETDDEAFIAEVLSPMASSKSTEHCQPALQTANVVASTHKVPARLSTAMPKCILPQDLPNSSNDTRSLAENEPVPPMLVSTLSEDAIYIPDELDMREKINTIRRHQGRHFEAPHKPEDLCAHSSHTVTTDSQGLELQLPSVEAPEVKNRAPFMSEDPAENKDIENPEWEAVRRLSTDEERYQAVQKVWHNSRIPDPHKELTTFHYRRRMLSVKHAKNLPPSKSKCRKRKASRSSSHEHVKPVKRQRFDTDIIDLKLKELKRKREKDVTRAQRTFRDDIHKLHSSLRRPSEEMYAPHGHGHSDRRHRRVHTAPWDFRYYQSQEMRICEEYRTNEENIYNEYRAREHKLLNARDEVRRVDAFYAGLRDSDPRVLSEEQVKEHLKLEEMLGCFKKFYKTPRE